MTRQRAAVLAALPWTDVDDHFIDGSWRPSVGTDEIPLIDPATGERWGRVLDAVDADVDAAVGAARRAFDDGPWRSMSPGERAEVMLVMADEIEKRAELLSWTNTLENGSPIAETGGAAANAAGILRFFAGLAGHLEAPDVRPFPAGGATSTVQRDPVGVCALIAPWNFPINLVMIKLAPALLAGCTTVIKPASPTPLSIRFIVEAAQASGIPPGVVNLITGSGQAGSALVAHPLVDKVAFTGSTAVGRRIGAVCGELLRPVTLELGGKSSAIVLSDADLAEMGERLVRTCLRNTGQTCYIATRILAPVERYEEVVELVADTIGAAKQGDPLEADTVFGPVATQAQFDSVTAMIESGKREGARVVIGGRGRAGRGFFVEPTVFADVTPDMQIAREEVFGPVITILPYRTVDEAVDIANSTAYGLGGVVFSADAEAAFEVAERMDTGSVGINFFASNYSAPFAGRHDSGLGVEYGVEGLSAYTVYKSIHQRG